MTIAIRTARQDSPQLPRTVGGRDAAPAEWKEWAEEPGHDLVALDGSRAIGGLHISIVGPSEGWLEMLRVLPDYRGRGVASQLVREGEQIVRKYGAGTIRTAIPAHDYAALGVSERAGFRRVLQCVVLEAEIPSGPLHLPYDAPTRTPAPASAPDVLRFLEGLPTLAAWGHLIPLGWRFRLITPELLKGLIKDRRVIIALHPHAVVPSPPPSPAAGKGHGTGLKAGEAALQAVAMFHVREGTAVFSLIDGTPSGMQAAFASTAEVVRDRAERVAVFTPDAHAIEPLDLRGWAPHPWCPEGLTRSEERRVGKECRL